MIPEKRAIRFGERDITYAGMEAQIARLAGGLEQELGVKKGDRVAYLGNNSPEILQVLFACARIGAILAPLNSRMTVEQLNVFLDHFRPRCFFAETAYAETATACLRDRTGIPLVVFEISDAPRQSLQSLSALFNGSPHQSVNTTLPKDHPLLLVYTSGTTGMPKGAMQTQETLFYSAMNAINVFEMTRRDEILTITAMSHVGGLTVHTLPAMYVGATVTIHPMFDPLMVLRDIERYRVTLLSARPFVSKPLTAHPDFRSTNLASLRSVASGSTKVPMSVMEPWFNRGIPVQQNYGLTEAVPPAIVMRRADASRKRSSIGKPVPHCQGRVVDEDLRDVEPGERGQIILKGQSLFTGYWENKDATREAFQDGWFLTGDVGHVDDEGFFYVDDRIKDIIIVGSSNVYPDDVERILSECSKIEEAAVVGRPDPDTGEAVVACIKLKKDESMTEDEAMALFENRLADYQKPRDIVFMDSIPYTLGGKIQKTTLRQLVSG